jgi:thiamine-monophosphate kinase
LDFYKFFLLGGNTTRSDKLCLDLSLIGEAKRAVYRDTPRVGDRIFVSGTLGDSRAGLEILLRIYKNRKPKGYYRSLEHLAAENNLKPHELKLVERHLQPVARLDLSPVVERFASASMDISDGFLSDLAKMVKNLTAEVDLSKVPLSEELKQYCAERGLNPLDYALRGGEDYQLLVCSDRDLTPYGFKEVGKVISEGEGKIFSTRGDELKAEGFDHLKG